MKNKNKFTLLKTSKDKRQLVLNPLRGPEKGTKGRPAAHYILPNTYP